MIDTNNLLNIIKNNKEVHNYYKLQINNNNDKIYGYIKDIEVNDGIICFNYTDYFTGVETIYKMDNNINSSCIIVNPDKMRGIFTGIVTIYIKD